MKLLDLLTLLLLGALWGSSYLFMRVAAPEIGPVSLVAIRVTVASCMLLPFTLRGGRWRGVVRARREIFIVGCLSSVLPFCLFAYAALSLTAGYSSVLNSTTPLFTALIAWLWLQERLSLSEFSGLAVGLVGVGVLASDQLTGFKQIAGLAALLAAFCYGVSTNFIRLHLQNVGSLELAAGSQFVAALILLFPGIWFWPQQPVSSAAWLSALVLGIAGTGIAYVLFFRLINSVGATRAITVTYLVPVSGMILGAVFLDEHISLKMIVGCGLILIGTGLATGLLPGWRAREP